MIVVDSGRASWCWMLVFAVGVEWWLLWMLVVYGLTNETESVDLRRERGQVSQGPAHPVALAELDSWAAFLPDHLWSLCHLCTLPDNYTQKKRHMVKHYHHRSYLFLLLYTSLGVFLLLLVVAPWD